MVTFFIETDNSNLYQSCFNSVLFYNVSNYNCDKSEMKTYWKSIKQFILFYSTLNIYVKTCDFFCNIVDCIFEFYD